MDVENISPKRRESNGTAINFYIWKDDNDKTGIYRFFDNSYRLTIR